MAKKMVAVHWYTCNCAEVSWITKYCDEHHRACAIVPESVLNEYQESVR